MEEPLTFNNRAWELLLKLVIFGELDLEPLNLQKPELFLKACQLHSTALMFVQT